MDVAPPGLFSCQEQQAWGMCDALNATGFCAVTCGSCALDAADALCDDIATPDGTPCSQVGGEGQDGAPGEPQTHTSAPSPAQASARSAA